MELPAFVKKAFDREGISYEVLRHPFDLSPVETAHALQLNPAHVAQATMLRDAQGVLMAVYPATTVPDLDALNLLIKRNLVQLTAYQTLQAFPDCDEGLCAPTARIYGVQALVDNALMSVEQIYLVVGSEVLCRVGIKDFVRLQGIGSRFDISFAVKPRIRAAPAARDQSSTGAQQRRSVRDRIESLKELPAMPGVAHEILQLRNNPLANATDLSAVIEQDPSLAAQLLRYARSPFYGYRGEIDSIQDAISRVLGFDMVLDMALGVAVGKAFRNPEQGRLGLNSFWRHAMYCAVLVQRLGGRVDNVYRPRPGVAYLAGLLHNMGHLLLGHLFPREFKLLNDAVTRHPRVNIAELEQRVLGITHMEMGGWLLDAWNMHAELVIAAREHHDEGYNDAHAVYPNLVLIANRLLSSLGIGEELTDELPRELLQRLGLSHEDVMEVFQDVLANQEGLDYMALQMAA